MPNLEMKVHLSDIEEVTKLRESAREFVETIEANNFVYDSGLPLKWIKQYVNLRIAITNLNELTKNRP